MKMKNLVSAMSVALCAFALPFASFGTSGDIYEIRSVSGSGASPAESLKPGQTLQFKFRLLAKDWETPAPSQWVMTHVGIGSEAWDAVYNPLQVGIVVSGRTKYARIVSYLPFATGYTDVTCEYQVEPGDIAFPVRLALKGSTPEKPIIAGESDTDIEYCLKNAEYWAFKNAAGAVCKFTYCNDESAGRAGNTWKTKEEPRIKDIDLAASGKFYVQGVRFSEQWDSTSAWRTVHEGTTTTSLMPTIETIGVPTNAVTLYVWSDDESSVKIPESKGTWTMVKPATTDPVSPAEYRWVRKIEVLTGISSYTFEIEGVTKDTTTKLILSPTDHYVYNGAGTLCEDFLTVPVACDKAPPAYVSVTVDGGRNVKVTPPIGEGYNVRVATVQVKLSQACDHDVTVTLKPSIPSKPGKAWGDYIGLSEYSEGGAHDGKVTVTFTAEDLARGMLTQSLQLYALGSDADTIGPDETKAIRLDAEVDAASQGDYPGEFEYAWVFLMRTNPVIVQPEFGDEFPDIQGGTTYNFKLKVADTYKNASVAAPAAGYVIYAKTGNTGSKEKRIDCPTTADKTWHLDAEGGLVENDGFLPVAYDTEGDYWTEIRLVAPDGQKSKYTGGVDIAPVRVHVHVSAPKTVEAVVSSKTWNEGALVPVGFKIGPEAHTETVWAFLKPKKEGMADLVSGDLVIKDGYAANGVEISQGDTESLSSSILRLLDGKSPDLMGTSLQFDIILWKNAEYDETETQYAVEGFGVAKVLQLTVNNVEPKVSGVERTGGGSAAWTSAADQPKLNVSVSKGVVQRFTLQNMSKNEPGVLDLPTMRMKWKFSEYNEEGAFVLGGENTLEGTPALTPWEHTFKTAGYTLVTVQLMDKDMAEYPGEFGTEYTFRVDVSGDPSVTVAENGFTFNEADSTGKITVRLSQMATDPIEVKAVVTPYETSADPGRFVLDQTKRYPGGAENEYLLTFEPGTATAMENILTFSDLDGTLGSQQKGFRVALTVLTKTLDPDGRPYDEVYHAEDGRIFLINEKPMVIAPATNGPVDEKNKGYVAQIGANESRAITFTIANDVDADVEAGFKVTFICTGGSGTLDGTAYTGPVTIKDLGSHTFVPNFTSQGAQQITLRIEDKDTNAGTEVFECTWYYDVQAAKTLRLIPHGPTSGFTTSALSQRYADYAAEGHVWANVANPTMKGFNLSYNCGTSKAVDIYAFGYKVASPVDNGTLNGGRDVAINPAGDGTAAAPYYTYADADDRDSFFYRWILVNGGSDEGGNGAIGGLAPEHAAGGAAQGSVGLPSELGEEGAYDETIVEAVFSYEWLWSDNVGDMNQDGIPDVFLTKTWAGAFGGLVDPATGEVSGNDLTKLNAFNDDVDYLPAVEVSRYGTIIPDIADTWVTYGKPFDAVTEVRGYHKGLNDALTNKMFPTFVKDVKPELVYAVGGAYDPVKCTISELEFIAFTNWCGRQSLDWADKANWAKWSPERPTDPTVEDTDEDGMPDGYEYYFWYRAHVGYIDGDGTYRRMEGRRFDPTNPAIPEIISADELEVLMDPLTPGDKSTVNMRDSDNDGLPDLVEFERGTNPFDFDTDGDGLPDGYEIAVTETDPLLYATDKVHPDGELNTDNDFMAETEMTLNWVDLASTETPGVTTRFWSAEAFAFTNVVSGEAGEVTNTQVLANGKLVDAWRYGSGDPEAPWALGGAVETTSVTGGAWTVVANGSEQVKVLHYQVFMKDGFDPRVGWNDPKSAKEGHCITTAPFTHLDEFLVMSFYYRNGGLTAADLEATQSKGSRTWEEIWAECCTNPLEADTDKDGMPDGWELYVQMGSGKGLPSEEHCGPGPDCVYSPIYDFAEVTDEKERDPDRLPDAPGDGLDFVEEYAGIESTGRYSETCPTIQLTPDQERWQNKWWPTNPFEADTDGDGLEDGAEFVFIWDGAQRKAAIDDEGCIEGGGLNPLSWDTDLDGLPDPFELEFIGEGAWAGGVASTNATGSAGGSWNGLGLNGTIDDARLDCDHDGLANWQEYMTGSMRGWRYDDTVSPWSDGPFDPVANQYFSLCTNAFEQDAWVIPPKVYNNYYMFKDGHYHDLSKNTPNRFTARDPGSPEYDLLYENGQAICPQKYICTSPLEADTDHDGMDDYYELFHGLNPLLGASGVSSTDTPCDVIFGAYLKDGDKTSPWFAEANYWIEGVPKNLTRPETPLRNTGLSAGSAYDFFQFPWLGGLARADVDGDNIRNQNESIMPCVQAASTFLHTDPTPLWMTDSSYGASLVTRYYYLPASAVTIAERWMGSAALGTMFSYEENEGFDSDHDFLGDFEETQGKTKTASDPQWHDSPLRRQAMWLNGVDAFLQTALPEFEASPASDGVLTVGQNYLYFTVECWAKPDGETLDREQTLVERSVYTGKAGPSDAKYLRKNFLIGIKNGRWYAKFDSSGVDEKQSVEITNGPVATTNWTHVAFTYGPANDNQGDPQQPMRPRLYVNGVRYNGDTTKVQPEHGVSALFVDAVNREEGYSEWASLVGPMVSFTVGASAETMQGVCHDILYRAGGLLGETTLADYGRFYRGYVDEVRIWDGARLENDIRHDYEQRVRYTDETALANREAFHRKWSSGGTRNPDSIEDLPARLMHHWSFDHIAGAVDPEDLMDVPAGFRTGEDVTDGMAIWARPKGWTNAWWNSVAVRSTVYTDTAWVPWINDTVGHLPRYDRTVVDSVYWSADYAGYLSALEAGYAQFYFPRHGEVPSRWVQMVCGEAPNSQDARYNLVSTNEELAADYAFTMLDRQTAGFDLLPMGGAYPKRISAAEGGMWDDQGAADAWAETGSDADHNGIPEWWERYARANYAKDLSPWDPFDWSTPVVIEGLKMPAWQAYMRDLARGMLPDGERHEEFIDIRDVDRDGIPDWWEDIYGVDTHSVADTLADPDGDGLGNYVEYLITEKFKYAQLDPNEAKSDGVCIDYFRKVGDLYLGEIFTDHDQVNDVWENKYAGFADFYAYDPSRDDDGDGWSNWAEQNAGTDPRLVKETGIDDYTLAGYPVPCIRARIVNNGLSVETAPVVIKAWSELRDPDMTGDPDATWTVAGSATAAEDGRQQTSGANGEETNAAAAMGESSKYLGIKPDGTRTLTLGPGAIERNSVKIFYKDLSFCKAVVIGDSIIPTEIGSELEAQWYYLVHDREGKLYTTGGIFADEQEVGTVDYDTGAVTIDFGNDALCGITLGNAGTTDADGNPTYDLLNLDQSYVLVTWNSSATAGSLNRTLYLSDADDPGDISGRFDHVREGLNTFIAFVDRDGDGAYTAGEPYGFVRGVDVGWSGAAFEIELTETSPVFARVNVFDGASDRLALWGTSCGDTPGASTPTASNDTWGVSANAYEHVRVVPYMVAGVSTDGEGTNSFVYAVDYVENRVVAEFDVRQDTKPYITEADFIRDGAFDIDWDGFSTSAFANNSRLTSAVGEVTAVKYRVVFGNEGPVGQESNLDVSSPGVSSFQTLIERRFERTAARTKPTGLSVDGVVCGAQPLFGWRLDEPTGVQGATEAAARYGCSYTAFEIQVADRDGNVVYDSGVVRAPVRDADGFFRWTPADLYAGDQTALGKVFAATGNWQWRVAMYNSKFKPNVRETMNGWSAWQVFSTSVGTGNTLGDLAHETIDVSVKYTGPVRTLDGCEDLSTTKGTVRIQAFVSPDFSGEPVAQGFIADKAALTDVADTAANGRLIGLAPGDYYLRAYVDTNGNLMKDAWESWGAWSRMVTVGPGLKVPDITIFIEDADTDQDWIPDAWEMQVNGSLTKDNVQVLPDGQIKFKLIYPETKKTALKSAAAPVTFFQNLNAARMLLTSEADGGGDAVTEILDATQSKAVPGTVAITSLLLDTEKGEAVLTVAGETEKSDAAKLLDAIYVFPDQPLALNVYRKNALVEKDWTLVKENVPVILGSGTEEEVRVSLGDEIDPTSGFYMIKVVQ